MFASKMSVLKPLIESREGQHLTAYLTNDQNIFNLRKQIREVIDTAYEYLAPVMSPEALVRFIAPLHNAVDDNKLLTNLKGNVGIFRNESLFRIVSLPVQVESTCVVATTFHVKPLLRWIQTDREFLILGVNGMSASLYQGNQSSMNLVDSMIFPFSLHDNPENTPYEDLKAGRKKKVVFEETAEWLNEWLYKLTKNVKPQLFIVGQRELAAAFYKNSKYPNKRQLATFKVFKPDLEAEVCTNVRSILKAEARKNLDHALMEFYEAESYNLANKNIFQIAKAVVRGKVRKLIIADGINIFGKLDRKSGGLAIHPTHLNHEDDDVLDDLAQEVLARGGDVVIASREEIPKGRPILAILNKPDHEKSKYQSIDRNSQPRQQQSAV